MLNTRLLSIDALRGFLMGNLIVVFTLQRLPAGSLPDWLVAQMNHAPWHGMTYADIAFAGFVMLMGLSVRLSLSRIRDGAFGPYFRKIAVRAATLIFIGFLYNGGFREPWPNVRLLGVLQRLGICYFAAALLYRWTDVRGRIGLLVAILLGYWALLSWVPVPGTTAGDLSFHGNLVARFDSHYLPGRKFYGSWDSEGILSTLPAIGSAIIGILWGDVLRASRSIEQQTMLLIGGGLLAINVAVIWDLWFPINKHLWTSTFVLVTAGIGSLFVGGFHFVAERLAWRRAMMPLVVIGRNLLAAFVLILVVPFDDLALRLTGGDVAIFMGSVGPYVSAAVEICLIWGVLYILYRNNVTIRL